MQKKWLILPASLVVLCGIWLGATWYTGLEIEKNYTATIEKINQNPLFNIENVQLKRHLFSSDMQYQLTIGKQTFPLHTTIYHGPFPINSIADFNWLPQIFSSQTVLQKTAETEPFFAAFSEKPPFLLDFNFNYQHQSEITFLLNSGKVENQEITANWQQSHYRLDIDANQNIKSVLTLPYLDLKVSGKDNSSSKLLIEQLTMNADLQRTNWLYLPTGKINTTVKFMRTDEALDDKNLTVTYLDQHTETNLTKQGDFYALHTNNSVGDLSLNGRPFLSGYLFNLQLNHFHGNSIVQWINAALQDDKTKINQALDYIFNNQPQLVIKPLRLTNNSGKAELTVTLTPEKDAFTNFNTNAGNFFAQFNIALTFDKTFQKNFAADILKALNGINDSQQATESAKTQQSIQQKIERVLQTQVEQDVLIETDNAYQLHFEQKAGDFYLNQQKVAKEVLILSLLQLFSTF